MSTKSNISEKTFSFSCQKKEGEIAILSKCDYAVIDDLFKVIPPLTEEMKKLMAN